VHFVFGAVDDREGKMAMGHYARGSRQVVSVGECPVHDDRGNAIAFALRDACVKTRSGQTLKSVAVRVGCRTPETTATLVVTNANEKRLRAATSAVLAGDAAPTSMHLNIHPKDDAFIFGRETRRLIGPARLREDVAGVSFLISPTSFFQTNVRAAEMLVQLVLAAVPQGATVLDLYAGAGLFALPLARRGHAVIAVEENRDAVADGVASRDLNGIPEARCRFIAAPVERVVGAPAVSSRRRRPATPPARLPPVDIVVLDPPRQGCERSVLHAVFGGMTPPHAVYVSCDPESLAVDLRLITQHGYAVRSIQPVDMFPHTPHIEAVVVVERV
jgi:23S rRNA (uracil1939-C5)-methyltransferase